MTAGGSNGWERESAVRFWERRSLWSYDIQVPRPWLFHLGHLWWGQFHTCPCLRSLMLFPIPFLLTCPPLGFYPLYL